MVDDVPEGNIQCLEKKLQRLKEDFRKHKRESDLFKMCVIFGVIVLLIASLSYLFYKLMRSLDPKTQRTFATFISVAFSIGYGVRTLLFKEHEDYTTIKLTRKEREVLLQKLGSSSEIVV